MKNSLVALGAAGILAGGASAQAQGPTLETGPDAEVTVDGLYRVVNPEPLQIAYLKPDMNLDGYTAFMLDPVAVAYQMDPGGRTGTGAAAAGGANFALTPTQMEELKGFFREAVVEALSGDGAYRIVETPGPDVLRITAQLIDLIVRTPTQPGSSTLGTTRSYGEVTLVLELRDSQSGEILGMAADRQDPTRTSGREFVEIQPSRIRTDTRRLFEYWADILRESLDELRAVEIEPSR